MLVLVWFLTLLQELEAVDIPRIYEAINFSVLFF